MLLSHYNIVNNVLQLDGFDGHTDFPNEGRMLMAVLPREIRLLPRVRLVFRLTFPSMMRLVFQCITSMAS